MTECIKSTVCEERTKRGETQEQLAEAVDVTRQTIIALEKGNYTPSIMLALKIAHHMNRRVEDIFWVCDSE